MRHFQVRVVVMEWYKFSSSLINKRHWDGPSYSASLSCSVPSWRIQGHSLWGLSSGVRAGQGGVQWECGQRGRSSLTAAVVKAVWGHPEGLAWIPFSLKETRTFWTDSSFQCWIRERWAGTIRLCKSVRNCSQSDGNTSDTTESHVKGPIC